MILTMVLSLFHPYIHLQVNHRLLSRRPRTLVDYNDTVWGHLLNDLSQLRDPYSLEAILFRRRFRIPFHMFEQLLNWTKAWWRTTRKRKDKDASGRPAPDVGLKLLGVLRILGRGSCLDDIKELSGISEPTMHAFFEEWCEWFRADIFPVFVHPPRHKEELEAMMVPYALVGLNGAFTSTDAVHLRWDKCPASLHTIYTGTCFYEFISFPFLT